MAEPGTPRRWAPRSVRVIDVTWILIGPRATRLLASFGAEVIRVERRAPRAADHAPLFRRPPCIGGGAGVLGRKYLISRSRLNYHSGRNLNH
jgi:CoA-transferase family III